MTEICPLGRFAYMVNSADQKLHSFKVDAVTGALTASGTPLAGGAPSYIAADPTGHFVYVSQVFSAGIKGFTVNQSTGVLTEIPGSFGTDPAVFAGAIAFTPDGLFLFSSGNGLNVFAIEAVTGKLSSVAGSPFTADVGSDPQARNLTVDPRGDFVYATEFGPKSHVVGFAINRNNGQLTAVPGTPLSSSAPYSIAVDPSGRFVFVGTDGGQLAVFSLDRPSGALTKIDGSPFLLGGLQPEIAFASLAQPAH